MQSVLLLSSSPHEEVALLGVEAAGRGLDTDRHAATLTLGTVGDELSKSTDCIRSSTDTGYY